MKLMTGVRAKIEEKKPEWILAGIVFLVWLLVSAIWAAIPSETWGRISESTSKRTLWLCVGTAGLLISLLVPYVLILRRERKTAEAERANLQDQIDDPPKVFRFNAWWDKDGIPYCPVDKTTPLGNWLRIGSLPPAYHCPMHDHHVPLQDADGNALTPVEARRRLFSGKHEEPGKQMEGKLSPDLNEGDKKLLFHLARPLSGRDLPKITEELRLDPVVARYHADRLRERGLISRKRSRRALKEYGLTDKGVEYVTENRPDSN